MAPLPYTGPIVLDCRYVTASIALRSVEAVLQRVRGGSRTLVVQTASPDVVDAVTRWARNGKARYDVDPTGTLRVYLLPRDFGAHPLLAWRPPLRLSGSRQRHT